MDDMTREEMLNAKAVVVGLIKGPMEAAWQQAFQNELDALAPLLVIVWHSEWMRPSRGLWGQLLTHAKTIHSGTRILVIIFGDTPDQLGEEKQGRPLGALLRAIAQDSSRPGGSPHSVGWASISDVPNFESAAATWHPGDKGDSAFLRLCEVCAALSEGQGRPLVPTLEELFQFLDRPVSFRAPRPCIPPRDLLTPSNSAYVHLNGSPRASWCRGLYR